MPEKYKQIFFKIKQNPSQISPKKLFFFFTKSAIDSSPSVRDKTNPDFETEISRHNTTRII
jgi:hypothetical protein